MGWRGDYWKDSLVEIKEGCWRKWFEGTGREVGRDRGVRAEAGESELA